MTTSVSSIAWHKPLSVHQAQRLAANDPDPLLGAMPDVVNGAVVPAAHVVDLLGPAAYVRALGLVYPGSPFAPDQELFSLRFMVSYAFSVEATDGPLARSIGKTGGAELGYGNPPYTGSGFTAAGYAIPEYWMLGGVLSAGELWYVPVGEPESLAAVLTGTNEWSRVRKPQ